MKKNNDINNVRPITISDSLANIFEMYILQNRSQVPETQSGFKHKSSTNHAIYVLDETIKHYKNRRKTLYMCAIDARKAFEKVNRDKLLH
jgi:hypothetical protein